jgi:hypothetical protein
VYQTICENGGFHNWQVIEVEKFPCNDFNESLKRERHWMEQFGNTLNMRIPSRSQKEYKEVSKEKIKVYKQQYRKDNIEKIKESAKIYQETHKDKLKECKQQYRKDNIQKLKIQRAEFYQKSKDNLLENHLCVWKCFSEKLFIQTP